ncbi:PP2C family serine/threonine-protein phosphatase [Sphingomonas echinoides]|uniref:PP2C family serine/threonine-protein phosphatase n=1 Tax=Sphingomonas echinoides TaxID=59803 RepID=A0ABU4PHV2_9SPHN|nr:PP2C family serine/threonine-protein phosphatase [Sphingomonas echinoides]MDX5983230.1 PP2C family serine/threonine-protein phosphatase [Sphingomonas echinoides]
MSGWRWVGASRRGVSHAKAGTRKQDAYSSFLAEGGTTLVTIVSDGAGSASHGGEGASLICRTMGTSLRRHLGTARGLPGADELWLWIDEGRDRIGAAASTRGLMPRDFAATMVLIVTTGDETLVAHVGDGSAVARDVDSGRWSALSWPAQGEYASTTFFVTDDPAPRMRVIRSELPIDAVAVFTDGIERLALDYADLDAHQPFFRGMIAPLEEVSAPGLDRDLSVKLGAYLDAPAVCDRTDDDKTLILAFRR